MTPETFIKHQIKLWLKGEETMGNLTWWNNVQTLGSWQGLGDISVLKNGKYYEFEVKSAKGKVSEKQVMRHLLVTRHKANYSVVRSFEEVRDILNKDEKET